MLGAGGDYRRWWTSFGGVYYPGQPLIGEPFRDVKVLKQGYGTEEEIVTEVCGAHAAGGAGAGAGFGFQVRSHLQRSPKLRRVLSRAKLASPVQVGLSPIQSSGVGSLQTPRF